MRLFRSWRVGLSGGTRRCRFTEDTALRLKIGMVAIALAIHPTRPDLPILRQYWFFVSPIPENYPLNEAKRRIDHVLESSS